MEVSKNENQIKNMAYLRDRNVPMGEGDILMENKPLKQKTIIPISPILIKDLGTQFPKEKSKYKIRYGLYKCGCGAEFRAASDSIKRGLTRSCGCYNKQRVKEIHTNHGMYQHKLYHIWSGIVQRCNNPKNLRYKSYGGRGIVICERWLNIDNFIKDMYPTFKDGLSIDRRDNDKGYFPENCRWATNQVQGRNTRILFAHNTSGYRGVSFDKNNSKWVAQICVNGKRVHIGRYITAIEASMAYDGYVITNKTRHTLNKAVEQDAKQGCWE